MAASSASGKFVTSTATGTRTKSEGEGLLADRLRWIGDAGDELVARLRDELEEGNVAEFSQRGRDGFCLGVDERTGEHDLGGLGVDEAGAVFQHDPTPVGVGAAAREEELVLVRQVEPP